VLRALVHHPAADRRRTGATLGLMGFSLGGNVTLKLLGEPTDGLPVVAGVSVSAPLDLAAGSEYLHHVAFGLYEQAMVRGLRRDVARFGGAMSVDERAAIAAARRIEEFDDAFTARRNGWRDAAEYYAVNSSAQYLPRIRVPTLVVHALDDPVVPSGPYLSVDWDGLAAAGFVERCITRHGGHVGFHQRGTRAPWYADRAAAFFLALPARDRAAAQGDEDLGDFGDLGEVGEVRAQPAATAQASSVRQAAGSGSALGSEM
jgi:predicted alpha/beta-fold hydrolase